MNSYAILIPQLSLLLGIMTIMALEIWIPESKFEAKWIVQTFVLLFGLAQQLVLYRLPLGSFARGAVSLDGVTQILSLGVFILALYVQVSRRKIHGALTVGSNLLFLGSVIFALTAIQSNRLLVGVIAVFGMIWTSHAALWSEAKEDMQSTILNSSFLRALIFLLVGAILCMACFAIFGETQIDEIQKIVSRSRVLNGTVLSFVVMLILFLGTYVMGFSPFHSLLGQSRKQASWGFAAGFTGLFALVGFNIFVRWAILGFSRPAVGGLELESLTQFDLFFNIRLIACVGLIATPVLALLNDQIRPSFLMMALNPFVQALFAISFGQREVATFALAGVFISIFTLGLLISTSDVALKNRDFTWQDWMGSGRRNVFSTLVILMALFASTGMVPFFGSILLQKTLCINSFFTLVLLANMALSGFYVARLSALAFQRNEKHSEAHHQTRRREKILLLSQLIFMIFMGIFWQPLYKYSAFSIKSFFGEI